jgi:hypothetical protein
VNGLRGIKNKLRVLVGKPYRDKLEDLSVDGTLVLKRILQKRDGGGGVYWIHLAQVRGQ